MNPKAKEDRQEVKMMWKMLRGALYAFVISFFISLVVYFFVFGNESFSQF